jgi:large subunit ribosomal protein L28
MSAFIFSRINYYIYTLIFEYKTIGEIMARICQMTGKNPMAGNNVSHAHNRTKRRFLPNLQKKRIWVQELNRFVTLQLSAEAIKNIAKNGTSEIAKLVQTKKVKAR